MEDTLENELSTTMLLLIIIASIGTVLWLICVPLAIIWYLLQ